MWTLWKLIEKWKYLKSTLNVFGVIKVFDSETSVDRCLSRLCLSRFWFMSGLLSAGKNREKFRVCHSPKILQFQTSLVTSASFTDENKSMEEQKLILVGKDLKLKHTGRHIRRFKLRFYRRFCSLPLSFLTYLNFQVKIWKIFELRFERFAAALVLSAEQVSWFWW